jgi:hypothetical protein
MLTITQKSAWIFLLVCLISFNGYAATRTWTGNGSDNLVTNPANWQENAPAGYGDDLIFPATANLYAVNNNLLMSNGSINTQNFRSITVNGNNYTISGANTSVLTQITVNSGSLTFGEPLNIGGTVLVAQEATLTATRVCQSNSFFTIDGAGTTNISTFCGLGGGSITKTGTGTATVIQGGTNLGSVTANGGRLIYQGISFASGGVSTFRILSGTVEGNAGNVTNLIIDGPNSEYKMSGYGFAFSMTISNGGKFTARVCTNDYFFSGLNLNNAVLNPNFDNCPNPPNLITLLRSNAGGGNVTGNFNGYPEGAAVNVNGKIYRINYRGGGLNNVVLVRQNSNADFDGDGKTDLSVFRPTENNWYLLSSLNNGYSINNFGLATDKLVPADYDGDQKTDIAVFRNDTWRILRSRDGLLVTNFGLAGDIPIPADYDNDGKAEVAVYREGAGGGQSYFYYRGSSNNPNNNITFVPFGLQGDKPVVGDFNGDGKADFAVYRQSNGTWYILPFANFVNIIRFGIAEDKPVVGDYDGDGVSDIAVYRSSTGTWHYLQSRDNSYRAVRFGLSTDVPSVGDYDGDSKSDIAVFRPTEGNWYILQSSDGLVRILHWGQNGDTSIPSVTQP